MHSSVDTGTCSVAFRQVDGAGFPGRLAWVGSQGGKGRKLAVTLREGMENSKVEMERGRRGPGGNTRQYVGNELFFCTRSRTQDPALARQMLVSAS